MHKKNSIFSKLKNSFKLKVKHSLSESTYKDDQINSNQYCYIKKNNNLETFYQFPYCSKFFFRTSFLLKNRFGNFFKTL